LRENLVFALTIWAYLAYLSLFQDAVVNIRYIIGSSLIFVFKPQFRFIRQNKAYFAAYSRLT